MNANLFIFLIGLFGVPLVLLAAGHKLRRRDHRVRAAFWGGIIGHIIAGTLAITWGMIPPEAWSSEETARGFVGLWSLLLFPAAGALLASIITRAPAGTAR